MSAFGKLVLIAVVGSAAGWVGLAAGGKGWTPAMLTDVAQTQLTALLGRRADAMPAEIRSAMGPMMA